MGIRCRTVLILGALAALVGCDPQIDRDQPVEATRAIFDPVTGQIPLPNDALWNPDTGLLEIPEEPGDTELTRQIKQGLARINGWIPGSVITIPFDQRLDPSTLDGQSVRLYDVTGATNDPPAFERIDPDSYYVAFNVGRTPAMEPPYLLYVRRKPVGMLPPDFALGHRYLVVVTDDVRDEDGGAVLGTTIMELLKSRTPLLNEFGRSQTILPDADAAELEWLRSASYAPAFDVLEAEADLSRDRVIAHAAFRIQSNPMPAFNPMVIGNELPRPFGDPSATNDAFEAPWACFHHPIDESTASAGAMLFERGGSLTEVSADVRVGPVEDPNTGNELCERAVILDAGPLKPSTTYQVVMTDAIVGPDGAPSRQSAIFSLVAKTTPLIDTSTDPPGLNSPYIDSTFDALLTAGKDPTTTGQQDWGEAYATLVGPLALGLVEDTRKEYQAYIENAVATGIAREDITVTWVFTTAAP